MPAAAAAMMDKLTGGEIHRSRLFVWFMLGVFIVLLLFGVGMMIVVLTDSSNALASKLLTTFSAMFSGALGLGSGYLLGAAQKPPDIAAPKAAEPAVPVQADQAIDAP